MSDNVTPFRNVHRENFERGEARVKWHTEVARAISAAIQPLAQKAPPGESIEVHVPVATKGSGIWIRFFLDSSGTTVRHWLE